MSTEEKAAYDARHTPRKLFVFDFDQKKREPQTLLIPAHWTLEAAKRKVSDVCDIRPIADLHLADGRRVQRISQIPPVAEVVVTRHGGKPFDIYRLPEGVSTASAERSALFEF
jgi:hypothetical protein